MSKTTTDRSAEIRADLKRFGYSSRQVSVKTDYYAGGSSIRIKIKDATVPSAIVKAVAEGHESIRRCDFTHEILSGGNRFVFVEYDHDAAQALAAPYVERVKAALAQVKDNYLIPVEGTDYMIGSGRHGNSVAVWGKDGHITEAYEVEWAARTIAERELNAREIERVKAAQKPAESGLAKLALVRDDSIPVGQSAPMHVNCPCGAKIAIDETGKDNACNNCGLTVDARGWIVAGATRAEVARS